MDSASLCKGDSKKIGNIATQSYNGTTAFKWFADRTGAVTRHQDLINNIQYDSDYDVTGRLVRQNSVSMDSNKSLYALEYGYDLNNNVSKLVNIADGKTAKNEYVYGKDNLPEKYTIDGGRAVTYTYDTLNRLQKTSIGTTKAIDMGYVYWLSKRNTSGSDKYRTTKIKQETIGSEKYSYDYDAQGDITSIKKMAYNADGTEAGYTTNVAEYKYDELGQLVYDRDYGNNQLCEYTYDAGGNLLREHLTIYSTSGAVVTTQDTNYAYTDTNWKDKLTSYGGKTITYDEIGNPLSYRGMTMTWQNGRQLSTLQKGTTAVSYTYDANSTRATKTVNGVKYTYQYIGGKLIHETRGEKSFHYYYDANGYLTSIKYRLTPTGQDFAYYATHNWRGDVIGLYNGDGDLKVKYEYDTWGKVTSVKDANGARITDQNHVGNLNPFRYRGYYYDTESQLYYLMTRYYDPVTHRFLNADGYYQSGGGLLDTNMSAYCGNNPVNYNDVTGTRCHAMDNGRQGPLCPTNFITGYCPVCHKQDCCQPPHTITAVGDHKGVHLPNEGEPDTVYEDENGNWRWFDNNGNRGLDYHNSDHDNEANHPHGILNPNGEHMHEWGPNENGDYVPGPLIPWGGSVGKTLDRSETNNSGSLKWDIPTLPTFNPPMGDKPIYEKIWDDITRPFS